MIKLNKNKCGFTLLEMVIVIAIIAIISIVIFFSVVDYLNASKKAKSNLQEHNDIIDNAAVQISACTGKT